MAFSKGARGQVSMCGGPDAQKWRQAKDHTINEQIQVVTRHFNSIPVDKVSRAGSVNTHSSHQSVNRGILDML